MYKKIKNITVIVALLVSASIFGMKSEPAKAYSKSSTYWFTSDKGIRSDIWLTNNNQWCNQDFQVTAYYHGSNPYNANWIKTAWNFSVSGIGVSLSGLSANTGGSSFSGSWLNYNNYIATTSGSFWISGAALSGTSANTASLLVSGMVRSSSASIWRAY